MSGWKELWDSLDKITYGTAEVWKEGGVWTSASTARAVRLKGKTLDAQVAAVRLVLDDEVKAAIQASFDVLSSGMLTIDKHEGNIVSYKIVERLSVEKPSVTRRKK